MDEKKLKELFSLIAQLKPHEWSQLKRYVDKKYSSKQSSTPMPNLEELREYSSMDFPCIKNRQSECDKD